MPPQFDPFSIYTQRIRKHPRGRRKKKERKKKRKRRKMAQTARHGLAKWIPTRRCICSDSHPISSPCSLGIWGSSRHQPTPIYCIEITFQRCQCLLLSLQRWVRTEAKQGKQSSLVISERKNIEQRDIPLAHLCGSVPGQGRSCRWWSRCPSHRQNTHHLGWNPQTAGCSLPPRPCSVYFATQTGVLLSLNCPLPSLSLLQYFFLSRSWFSLFSDN